jgi:ABC-2 type transport system permease protein
VNTRYLAGDLRAMGAAARKEWRTLRRYPTAFLGTAWGLMLPATWVLMGRAYSGNGDPAALDAFSERAGTTGITVFIFVGYAMYMWLSSLLWGPGTTLRREQMQGSLEAVFVTPVSRLVPLFGPPMTNVFWMAMNMVVMAAGAWLLFGVVFSLQGALLAMAVTALGVPAMYAMGSLFGAAVLRFGEIGPAVQFTRGTLSLLCGITFPLVMLPAWALSAATVMPPTYIVDSIRNALLKDATPLDLLPSVAALVSLAVAFSILAVLTFRWMERSARRTGMLGRY